SPHKEALEELYRIETSTLPTTAAAEPLKIKPARDSEQVGVVDIDLSLDSTQILPEDWVAQYPPENDPTAPSGYPSEAPTEEND
ncbi:MAG: hypothetical protein F6J97_13965, partial [Leptolyngbya sp. SIO4C1]|nr:hypothetical protein [Leptolyngbya sp. SIO4C1]